MKHEAKQRKIRVAARVRFLRPLARFLVPLVLAAAVVIPAAAADGALPPAEEILDRYVEATGGVAAYDRVENRVMQATLEIVGQGIKLEMTIHQARPNLNYTVIESDLLGRVEKGTDGETAWDLSMMTGPQIMKGQQKTDFLRDATLDRLAHWRDHFAAVESAGIEEVGGRPCYKVVLTPSEGRPLVLFLDRETYLPLKMTTDLETPMGVVPMVTYPQDFRKVDGLLLAFGGRTTLAGQERSLTVHSVEHNVDLPADLFEPPDEIKTQLKKTASAG